MKIIIGTKQLFLVSFIVILFLISCSPALHEENDDAVIFVDASSYSAFVGDPVSITASIFMSIGDPVKNGTVVYFQSCLGELDSGVATTVSGSATVFLLANAPGVALVSAVVPEYDLTGQSEPIIFNYGTIESH